MKKFVLIFLLSILLTGCDQFNKITKQQQEIEDLKIQISKLNNTVKGLQEYNLSNALKKLSFEYALMKPSYINKYIPIQTDMGDFFISLDKLYKIPTGYEVIFSILNPSSVLWANAQLKLHINGKEYPEIIPDLYPARWTKVKVIISPAKEEDIQSFSVSISMENAKISGLREIHNKYIDIFNNQ